MRESLRANRRRFFGLIVAEGVQENRRVAEIRELATALGVRTSSEPRERLDERVTGAHQGVVLQASPYPYAGQVELENLATDETLLLALDGLEDPRNVGSLIRTAEAIGIGLVTIPSDRAAAVTPAVVNASAGATEHLQILQATNLARWLREAKGAGFWITGLAGGADTPSLFDTDVPLPAVLVVGSEGRGLRRLTREHCDLLVSLPMYGKIESLNAAVAGSVALYEIREYAGVT